MKPIQWIIAVVVLVLMVFAVTFVMTFLGESGQPGTTTTPPTPVNRDPILAFAETDPEKGEVTYPAGAYPAGMGFYDQELSPTGDHHDFLFENPTNEEVTVSLNSLSCHCASVSIFLASPSEDWRQGAARWVAAKAAEAANPPLLPVGFVGAADVALAEAAAKIQPLGTFEPDKTKETSFKVSPHAVGWVRVTWPGDKTGTNTYKATLETKTGTRQGGVLLNAKVRWVKPVYVADEIFDVGEFTAADLQKAPHGAEVIVFSATRAQFDPTASLVTKLKAGESPIVVGKPVYMQPPYTDLLDRLQKPSRPGQEPLVLDRILCAYRIPVEFRSVSEDKTRPMPLGRFRARVRVNFADEKLEPVVELMYGIVHGDVAVGGEGKLYFGTFNENSGSGTVTVSLTTASEKDVLEIDTEHTWPRLLNKELKLKQDPDDKRSWTLEVQILPHSGIRGGFPSDDNDEYFDTAVYVKIKGDKTRSLRIPSGGTAN